MTVTGWIVLVCVVAVLLVVLGWFTLRSDNGWGAAPRAGGRTRPSRRHFGGQGDGDEHRRRAAVIVNPTKFDDVDKVRATVTSVCEQAGWAEPLWIETTEDDPGAGQTRQALEEGVDLVCPLGGDGTVRVVGETLTGTGTPMGLLPGGTGNLLARNLDLPIDSVEKALRVALTGRNKRIDVGRLSISRNGAAEHPDGDADDAADTQDKIFLVMAGMGFDADIMANTDEDLKAKVGWAAYVVSGAQHLVGPRFHARVTTDDETFTQRTRSIIVGNVGKLQGGMRLMPDAVVDDGHLDALVLSPHGIVGWAAVAARLASRNRRGHSLVTHHTTTRLTVRSDRPVQLQIDGDPLGETTEAQFVVEHLALTVRVAPTTSGSGPMAALADRVDSARTAVAGRLEGAATPTTTEPGGSTTSGTAS